MMSFHRPHPPLDPPEHYLQRYLAREMPDPVRGDWAPEAPPLRALDSPHPTDRAQIDMARRAYYAQITHIDHQLNRMFMALYAHGVLENTAILFTADHGEMLYDHNLTAKGTPFEASARLPFILRLPGATPGAQPQQVDEVVELRDLLPTFCDLAGVPVPDRVDGRSVLPLCRGETAGWRAYLHGEHVLGADSNQWLTDGREKYIWYTQSGRQLLFDTRADPQELHDLSGERPACTRNLQEDMYPICDHSHAVFAQNLLVLLRS